MELEYSIDELFPKCKIRPKLSAEYESDSEPGANEMLSKEDFYEDSDESTTGNIRKYARRSSSSIDFKEEAEGQEDYDSREEGEGEEEEEEEEGIREIEYEEEEEEEEKGQIKHEEEERRKLDEIGSSEFETEEDDENEMQIHDYKDEDVDGDYDDDSIDYFQRHKSHRNTRLKKSLGKPHRKENQQRDYIDSEDECTEDFNSDTTPSLGIEEVASGPRKKCVPHRGFWKRTKDNIGLGFSNFWEKIKDGSRGIRNRLRNNWGRNHQKKLGTLHDDTNSYEGEDEEDTSSKIFSKKPN